MRRLAVKDPKAVADGPDQKLIGFEIHAAGYGLADEVRWGGETRRSAVDL